MRILGIERDKTACNYYRVLQPLYKLDELGLAEVQMLPEHRLGEEYAAQMALWADILVFQRPASEAWFNFIKLCRKLGKIVVSDYDDDPFNVSPLSPAYQHTGTEPVEWVWADGTREMLWSEEMVSPSGSRIFNIERNIANRDMFRLNFKRSDMVTCTTPELQAEFKKVNPNTVVLPNLIDPAFFPSGYEFVKREVRIGWQGGASHYEDLFMLRPSITKVLVNNPSVKFCYFGDMRFVGMFKDAPQDQIEYHPWVNHGTYPYKLALMNLDIGLCPLVDNQFNRNKSAIKWMEYSVMGMATVASNIPPYAPVMKNGETGLLVSEDEDSWIGAMQTLIDNRDLRTRLAENARREVLLNHNADTKAHLWRDAYARLMKGEVLK